MKGFVKLAIWISIVNAIVTEELKELKNDVEDKMSIDEEFEDEQVNSTKSKLDDENVGVEEFTVQFEPSAASRDRKTGGTTSPWVAVDKVDNFYGTTDGTDDGSSVDGYSHIIGDLKNSTQSSSSGKSDSSVQTDQPSVYGETSGVKRTSNGFTGADQTVDPSLQNRISGSEHTSNGFTDATSNSLAGETTDRSVNYTNSNGNRNVTDNNGLWTSYVTKRTSSSNRSTVGTECGGGDCGNKKVCSIATEECLLAKKCDNCEKCPAECNVIAYCREHCQVSMVDNSVECTDGNSTSKCPPYLECNDIMCHPCEHNEYFCPETKTCKEECPQDQSAMKCSSEAVFCPEVMKCVECSSDGQTGSTTSDPMNCPLDYVYCPASRRCISIDEDCNRKTNCPQGYVYCPQFDGCVPKDSNCNSETVCAEHEVYCPIFNKCVPMDLNCDSKTECAEDEVYCPKFGGCVPKESNCGGHQCNDDESYCAKLRMCVPLDQDCKKSCPSGLVYCATKDRCVVSNNSSEDQLAILSSELTPSITSILIEFNQPIACDGCTVNDLFDADVAEGFGTGSSINVRKGHRMLEIKFGSNMTLNLKNDLEFSAINKIESKGCKVSKLNNRTFTVTGDMKPKIEIRGREKVCKGKTTKLMADGATNGGGKMFKYSWSFVNTDSQVDQLTNLKKLVESANGKILEIDSNMMGSAQQMKFGVLVENFLGFKSEVKYKSVAITEEANMQIEVKSRIKTNRMNIIEASFVNCGSDILSKPIKCIWNFQPQLENFQLTNDCTLKIPPQTFEENSTYKASVKAEVDGVEKASSEKNFSTLSTDPELELESSEMLYASVNQETQIRFKSNLNAKKRNESMSCSCNKMGGDQPCDPSTLTSKPEALENVRGKEVTLKFTFTGRFKIVCKFRKNDKEVEKSVEAHIVSEPVLQMTIVEDIDNNPPGKSIIYKLSADFSNHANYLPILISMDNTPNSADTSLYNFQSMTRTIGKAFEKRSVVFELKNLDQDSRYDFTFTASGKDGNKLAELKKSIYVPAALAGGQLQFKSNNGSCLVDISVVNLVSSETDLTYQLIAGHNFVLEESTSSVTSSVFLPTPQKVLFEVNVKSASGNILKVKQKTPITGCNQLTETDMTILIDQCLDGNVKKCRVNLINMLSQFPTKDNAAIAQQIENQLKESFSDESNIFDLKVLIANINNKEVEIRNSVARKKREIVKNITTVSDVKELLTNYLLDSLTAAEAIEGVEQFVGVKCDELKEYGTRPFISKSSPDTKIQVLEHFINIFVHTETLGSTQTDTEDELLIDWDSTDEHYSNTVNQGVCVVVATYSNAFKELYKDEDETRLTLTSFLTLVNPWDLSSTDIHTPTHTIIRKTFSVINKTYDDLQAISFVFGPNGFALQENNLKTENFSSEKCSKCVSSPFTTLGFSYVTTGYVEESTVESAATKVETNASSNEWTTSDLSSLSGLDAKTTLTTGDDDETTSAEQTNSTKNEELNQQPFKRTAFVKILGFSFANLSSNVKNEITQYITEVYTKIDKDLAVTIVDYFPGSVIVKYIITGLDENLVYSASNDFDSMIKSGKEIIVVGGKSYKLSDLQVDDMTRNYPKNKTDKKWMHVIMGIVIGVFVLMVILVVMTACVVRYLYKGRNKVVQTPENPNNAHMAVPPGVAVLVPFGKSPYDNGLSTCQELLNVNAIPEPANYSIPDDEKIQNTPRLPTAIKSKIKHRENSAVIKDEGSDDDDDSDVSDDMKSEPNNDSNEGQTEADADGE